MEEFQCKFTQDYNSRKDYGNSNIQKMIGIIIFFSESLTDILLYHFKEIYA